MAGCDGVNLLLKPYKSRQGSQRQRQCSTLLKLCQWGRGSTVVAREQPGHKGSASAESSKLGLLELMEGVSCPAVAAWVSSGKWEQAPPREAVPLPLFVVAKLELALKDSAEDAWLLGAIHLMVWGGLTWSDVQRLQFSSLAVDDQSIRGWCWRTKSSKHGMHCGIQTCGVTPARWGQSARKRCLKEISCCRGKGCPSAMP